MADTGNVASPPSYNDAVKSEPSAPPSFGPTPNPPYPSQAVQPPYPNQAAQPPYPNQTAQPPYGQPSQAPYLAQPTPYGYGPSPTTCPVSNQTGYTYPSQPAYGQPGYSATPGQPVHYQHTMVTAGPTNGSFAAGYQTTPLAYGNTRSNMGLRRNRVICMVLMFAVFIIISIVIFSVMFSLHSV